MKTIAKSVTVSRILGATVIAAAPPIRAVAIVVEVRRHESDEHEQREDGQQLSD